MLSVCSHLVKTKIDGVAIYVISPDTMALNVFIHGDSEESEEEIVNITDSYWK